MSLPLKLIAGLGNPGLKYAGTRHNVGFWFIDHLASNHQLLFNLDAKFYSDTARIKSAGIDCRLLKSNTFMNESGRAVLAIATFYGIEPQEMLIVHDEIDLDAGVVRLKVGGGHGGHNGIRDIMERSGNGDFIRMRIGVGHPGSKDDVVHHLLHEKPDTNDRSLIDDAIERALDVMPIVFKGELNKVMTKLNVNKKPQVTSDQN